MATETLVITVCDVCESPEDVTSYTVQKDGSTKRSKIDLCKSDAIPLENLIDKAPKVAPGRKRTTRVTSMKDIEALKKPAKKTASKRVASKKVAAAKA